MATRSIPSTRIRCLNATEPQKDRKYVLYWMQQSQRGERNHALEHAVKQANRLELPLLVVFGLTPDYPEANARHYAFMLQGLAETAEYLSRRGIRMVVRMGEPDRVAREAARQAALVVCDVGYLRHQRRWRKRVAEEATCRVEAVETDVVVPVEIPSDKREYAARTFRPRFWRHAEEYLTDLRTTPVRHHSTALREEGIDLGDPEGLLRQLGSNGSVAPTPRFEGGTNAARRLLDRFIADVLEGYAENRRHPHLDAVSFLSPYLHFGQVSPAWVAHRVSTAGAPAEDVDAFLEELLVRRELAVNYVYHAPEEYDRYGGLPEWARDTLADHAGDVRDHLYSVDQLEAAETHDPYWNAAMTEMRETGYLHNHMRMYWGKKILEWQEDPEEAFETCLALNNRYFLDGRDPSSYANVGWIFGLHDRPWPERPVFGKVRYMSQGGLERKTDPEAYVGKVERLTS